MAATTIARSRRAIGGLARMAGMGGNTADGVDPELYPPRPASQPRGLAVQRFQVQRCAFSPSPSSIHASSVSASGLE